MNPCVSSQPYHIVSFPSIKDVICSMWMEEYGVRVAWFSCYVILLDDDHILVAQTSGKDCFNLIIYYWQDFLIQFIYVFYNMYYF